MNSIIESFYQGTDIPSENCIPHSPEYLDQKHAASQAEDAFVAKLSPELRQEYDHYMIACGGVVNLEVMQGYVNGFKAAIRLMTESLKND